MKKKTYTGEGHYHFSTFTCNGRRKLLLHDEAKRIVIHIIPKVIEQYDVLLIGFVVMPDHVHVILGYGDDVEHPKVIQEIKRKSSRLLQKYLRTINYPFLDELKAVKNQVEITRIWQHGYYDFNLSSPEKLLEKLDYMHNNPVKAEIVKYAIDYQWSSCQFYELKKSVGIKITPIF